LIYILKEKKLSPISATATKMADHVEEEVFDLSKMKMAELKAELGARGLKTSGKKAELIDRLQTYMEENEDVEVEDPEEDALLLDETAEADALNQESEPASQEDTEEEEVLKEAETAENNAGDDVVMEAENAEEPTADKVDDEVAAAAEEDKKEETPSTEEAPTSATADDDDLLLQSDDKDEVEEVPVTKKLMPRIEFPSKEAEKPKAGDGDQKEGEKKKLSEAERLEKRKARFGNLVATNGSSDTTTTKNKEGATDNNKSSGKTKVGKLSKDGAEIDPDKLKKRAERFGSTVASTLVESEQKDAIEKRKRRFGSGGAENGSSAETATTTDSEAEAKKAKRAERFQAEAATATA